MGYSLWESRGSIPSFKRPINMVRLSKASLNSEHLESRG